MMDYRFLLPAEEEITESAMFYEEKSEGLGADFLNEIDNSIIHICENPEIGPKYSGEMRYFVLARFPYSIIYAIEGNTILIIAIAHHRRKPGFWQNR